MSITSTSLSAEQLLGRLSNAEKFAALSGDLPFWQGLLLMTEGAYQKRTWNTPALAQHGLPGIRFVDGPRGVVIAGATTFPVAMARGASFDPELELRIGQAMGLEARAVGANVFGGICINLLRHPAWGRAQESFGEDPFHLGEMGAALVRGVSENVIACVKHFAANSMENARFSVDVQISARALHEIYLPHFKRAIDAGAGCVMSAYNQLNGQWCGQHLELLSNILKQRWQFQGFVMTDFLFGIRSAEAALTAGQDLEMPFHLHFHKHLPELVASGALPMARVDDAVLRLLRAQLKLPNNSAPPAEVLGCVAHRALAREAADKSIVLLKNDALLPLRVGQKIAVFGRLADIANTGDAGSSNTAPAYVVTPLQGLRAAFGSEHVSYAEGADIAQAKANASAADIAIVLVGYTSVDEGEFISPDANSGIRKLFPKPKLRSLWTALKVRRNIKRLRGKQGQLAKGGDRADLQLRADDEALIRAVCAANQNTIVVIMAGSAVLVSPWLHLPKALLLLWYPGMEGGHALAAVLSGAVNPSAKLPFVMPKRAEDLPFFDRNASSIRYDLWHGYRKLQRDQIEPEFNFGFGLSYSEFALSDLVLSQTRVGRSAKIDISATLRNCSQRSGAEVVQLYVGAPASTIERPLKALKAFCRVELAAGERTTVKLQLAIADLAYFDEQADDFCVELTHYELFLARHAGDVNALSAQLIVSEEAVE